jgi:hypothetical protein
MDLDDFDMFPHYGERHNPWETYDPDDNDFAR